MDGGLERAPDGAPVPAAGPPAAPAAAGPREVGAQPAAVEPGPERRRGEDRRRRPHLLSLWHWALRGRRRLLRRRDDRLGVYPDRYPARLLGLVLAIFLLSVLDAMMTLRLLDMGVVEEANPLMRPLLTDDVQMFATVKVLVTAVGLILLAAYANLPLFRRYRLERVTAWLLIAYALLVTHELVLYALATRI